MAGPGNWRADSTWQWPQMWRLDGVANHSMRGGGIYLFVGLRYDDENVFSSQTRCLWSSASFLVVPSVLSSHAVPLRMGIYNPCLWWQIPISNRKHMHSHQIIASCLPRIALLLAKWTTPQT